MSLKNKKAGDSVYLNCYSSMGASSEGPIEIIETDIRYDSVTGKPFNILIADYGCWDSRTGDSYVNKGSMYYITDIVDTDKFDPEL